MQVSDVNESRGRKLYVGVENFHVTAVNPTLAELNAMGIPATVEPTYHGKLKRDMGAGELEYDYFSVRVFLDNRDAKSNIRTQAQYTVLRDHHFSSTGKFAVINKYGTSTWLEEDAINSLNFPKNMQWLIPDGVKKAYRGEASIIDFIKALRSLNNIKMETPVAERSKGIINFDDKDLDKLFKGDFTDIRKIILATPDAKVGFLLGVKTIDGKERQALYNRLPLKAYVRATNSTDYLIKQVTEAQEKGSYADTYFDTDDTVIKEYDKTNIEVDNHIHTENVADDLPF